MINLSSLNPFGPATPSAATEVAELRIYPIKSCRGISVRKSRVTMQGLEFDRRWMFVDAGTRKFITIRDVSEMTLIDTAFATAAQPDSAGSEDGEFLVVSIRGTDKRVMVPARPTQQWLQDNTSLETVNIWDNDTDGHVYGEDVNRIFSEFFKRDVALVYKGPTPRTLRGNGAPEHLGRKQDTNFPDVMPVLIANEASIAELNRRLQENNGKEITIERFRPNIIVRGATEGDAENFPLAPQAWSEDSWKTVRVVNAPSSGSMFSYDGALDMDVQMRCARCQVPNVDPETAVKDKKEPWTTLMSYRRVDEGIKFKPCFGMLSAPRNEGPIAVGMKFEVVATTKDHRYIKGF